MAQVGGSGVIEWRKFSLHGLDPTYYNIGIILRDSTMVPNARHTWVLLLSISTTLWTCTSGRRGHFLMMPPVG